MGLFVFCRAGKGLSWIPGPVAESLRSVLLLGVFEHGFEFAVSLGLQLIYRNEAQAGGIDAVALAGGCRAFMTSGRLMVTMKRRPSVSGVMNS